MPFLFALAQHGHYRLCHANAAPMTASSHRKDNEVQATPFWKNSSHPRLHPHPHGEDEGLESSWSEASELRRVGKIRKD